jgi:hypothetical protein
MAQQALKYMLLSKIMTDSADEVANILVGKTVMKYSGPETEAMSALASAAKKRSLAEFNEVSDFSNCKNFGGIPRMYRKIAPVYYFRPSRNTRLN